jgi:hypothetical protein
VAADNKIGRFIADAVSSMPKLSPSSFDRLFNDRIQVTNYLFLRYLWKMVIMVFLRMDGHITFYVAGQPCAGLPVKHHTDSDRGG